MSRRRAGAVEPLPFLDDAETLSVRLLQPPFADVLAAYERIGFDAAAFARDLGARVVRARSHRSIAAIARNARAIASDERTATAERFGAWVAQLASAARYATQSGHPLADALEAPHPKAAMTADTWTQGAEAVDAVLLPLSALPHASGAGLPADFVARGVALREALVTARIDAARAEARERLAETGSAVELAGIARRLDVIDAATDLLLSTSPASLAGVLALTRVARTPAVPGESQTLDRGVNLLQVPLAVLLDQAADTRIHLTVMDAVRQAIVAAGHDLVTLETELDAAAEAGQAAALARRLSEQRAWLSTVRQQRVNAAFRSWAGLLRLRLDLVRRSSPAAAGAVEAVRKRVPSHPGRRFATTLASLRRIGAELRARADVLAPDGWRPDLMTSGEALRVEAEALAEAVAATDRETHEASRQAEAARERLQVALRGLRSAWKVAVGGQPSLPVMPVSRLVTYARHAGRGPGLSGWETGDRSCLRKGRWRVASYRRGCCRCRRPLVRHRGRADDAEERAVGTGPSLEVQAKYRPKTGRELDCVVGAEPVLEIRILHWPVL